MHKEKLTMAEASAMVLKNPLDADFKIRWMAQFTTDYLQEFIHACREELQEAHVEWQRLATSLEGGKRVQTKHDEALRRKRMISGRLAAVVRELNNRGARVPKLRVAR